MTQPARLSPGDSAPDFTLPDADGRDVSLTSYRGRHVILYFYPAAMTPGCTKEAVDFRDNVDDLAAAGYDVVGVSPDTPAKLSKFRDSEDLSFPLLSDVDREVMTKYGAYGEKMMYGKKTVGVIRSTVWIGPDGKVRKHWARVSDAAKHPEQVLAALRGG